MKIRDLLSDAIYPHVSIEESLHDVRGIMLNGSLEYLPVLDDKGNVFGIINSQIIAESHASSEPEAAQNIWEICAREFVSIHPDATIEDAVQALQKSDFGFIVLAVDGRYVGAMTSNDLLSKVTGSGEGGQGASAEVDLYFR